MTNVRLHLLYKYKYSYCSVNQEYYVRLRSRMSIARGFPNKHQTNPKLLRSIDKSMVTGCSGMEVTTQRYLALMEDFLQVDQRYEQRT